MPEEEQFRMTVVQMKRRPRSGDSPVAATENSRPGHGQEEARHTHSGGGHHRHSDHRNPSGAGPAPSGSHRHYNDFGTELLGSIDEARIPKQADAAAEAPSKGELQREFYDKYETALQRRYSTRDKGRVPRILMVAALMALIALLLSFGLGSLNRQSGAALPKPEMETIPVVT